MVIRLQKRTAAAAVHIVQGSWTHSMTVYQE